MSSALALLQAWDEVLAPNPPSGGPSLGSMSDGRLHTKRPAQAYPAKAPGAPMTPAEKVNQAAPRRGAGRIARSQPSEEDAGGCEDGGCDCCVTPGSGVVHARAGLFSPGMLAPWHIC